MSFNAVDYSNALGNFIIKAERISDLFGSEMSDALSDICSVLRVSKVFIIFYETPGHEHRGDGQTAVFYSNGEANPQRAFSVREMTGGGNIAIYQLLQKAGDADWTDEERSKLLVLEKGLFSFNGRARVMSMIDRLVFFDEEIGVNNLKFFMKTVGSYIAAGRIGQYGVCYFNLKRFSVINQNLGRDGGTAVMRKFISLLGEKLLDGEYVCRIGGDNFIVLFQKEHLNVIKEHLNGIGIIYDEKNNERVLVSAYAGFYLISPDCRNPSEIMDNVSIAANTAKNDLKRGVYFSTKI